MSNKDDPENKTLGTDELNRTLERLAVALEQQNAILFTLMQQWEYYQHEPPELLYESDSQTAESLASWVRDAESELGYRDMHGRVDFEDREDQ
jgi:hypothetical protein